VLDLSEKQIENSILSWLEMKGIYAWKTKTVGTFDVRSGKFIRSSRLYRKGVADVIGILPGQGRLFAIEVKSRKGKLQAHQKEFLDKVQSKGGLAFVARSIDEVETELRKAGVNV
jgi:penicillin-binding protein-related factor A (putative recombinase)